MLVFPQLTTGTVALYPVTKSQIQRTVLNTLDDGTAVVYVDARGAYTVWELHANGITLAEANAIDSLFQQTSGRFVAFTFLGPTDNLLAESGDLGSASWASDPSITLTGGLTDPLGGTLATGISNSASIAAQVAQSLNGPGNFNYCFSAWFRTTSGSSVTCSVTAGSAHVSQTFVLSTQWQRLFVSGNPGQVSASSVIMSLQLAAGATIQVYGPQAEAQLAPSDYKSTGTQSGVYSNARFASDQLTVTALATDVYDAVIQIVNLES